TASSRSERPPSCRPNRRHRQSSLLAPEGVSSAPRGTCYPTRVRYLPIQLDVRDRLALVIGSGREAASKVTRLVAAAARGRVLLAQDDDDQRLRDLACAGRIELARRPLSDVDLATACIVFAEPGDDALSQRLHAWSLETGKPVCTLDRPEWSTFANPAALEV